LNAWFLRTNQPRRRQLPPPRRRHHHRRKSNRQLACKPGSVWLRFDPERGSHSSGTAFARRLSQPTRMTGLETGRKACANHVIPIRSCSRWGLPCHRRCRRRGGLLPHPFTLTCAGAGGLLSVALSL